MSKDIRVIREDCCNIWNNLKDKTQMIDYLIESKQQIVDLEAKLAESEIRSKESEIFYKREINRRDTKLRNIKQQVAEKEEQLKESRKWFLECDKERLSEETKKNIAFTNYKETLKENKELKQRLEEIKNAKAQELADYLHTSIPKYIVNEKVELLEKVKEKLLEELDNVTELLDPLEYEDYHEFIGCGRGYKNSIEEIDNQIKQLKEKYEK